LQLANGISSVNVVQKHIADVVKSPHPFSFQDVRAKRLRNFFTAHQSGNASDLINAQPPVTVISSVTDG
jgi:hypothetical protein